MNHSPSEPWADQTVETPSATVTYRRTGPRGGVPLLLLNRVRATIDDWDPQLLGALAAERDLLVFDTTGTGRSTGTPPKTIAEFAEAAVEVVQALDLARVDLLGWTIGGTVAQELALHRPDLVRRLVLAASSPGGQVPGTPAADPRVGEILSQPAVGDDDLVHLFFPHNGAGRAAGYAHLARIAARPGRSASQVSPQAARGQLAALAASNARHFEDVVLDLGRIGQPALVATGLQDVVIPAHVPFVTARHLPRATFLAYGDAGHGFLFQHAPAFAAQVLTFLAD